LLRLGNFKCQAAVQGDRTLLTISSTTGTRIWLFFFMQYSACVRSKKRPIIR